MKFEEGQSMRVRADRAISRAYLDPPSECQSTDCHETVLDRRRFEDPMHCHACNDRWRDETSRATYLPEQLDALPTDAAHELAHYNWRTMEAEMDWEVDNG